MPYNFYTLLLHYEIYFHYFIYLNLNPISFYREEDECSQQSGEESRQSETQSHCSTSNDNNATESCSERGIVKGGKMLDTRSRCRCTFVINYIKSICICSSKWSLIEIVVCPDIFNYLRQSIWANICI